jgi:hypothetical protein
MSDLKLDAEVVQEGRTDSLKDVDVSLRDQIVQKLYDKLIEQDIPKKVASIWEIGVSNRSLWSERQRAWLSSWDEHLIGDTSNSNSGSSQLHIPMPFSVVKTMHARFLQALWQDPPFHIRPQNEASVDSCDLVSDVMRYYLMRGANYNKGASQVVDKWVWDWVSMGSGVIKVRWVTQYSKFLDVQTIQEPGPAVIQIGPDGKEVTVPGPLRQVEKEVERVKKCFDCPVLELVDLEDYLKVGPAEEPDHELQRSWLTASELWTAADTKIFNKDAVEEVIESGPDRIDGSVGSETKMDRARNAGKSLLDTEQDLDRYEIIEAYLKVDVDGSGINSDVIAWVHKKSRALLRATYLYRVSPSGKRPFAQIDFQPRKGQEYAVGIVELLYPLSKEMDAIHNMRIDWGLLSVMPFGFYRPSSGIDPQIMNYTPGTLFPVDNPQTDVFFPQLGNRTIFGMQEEAALQTMVERITSVSDLNLGLMNGQGATRTATGARALVGEMSSNLDVYLRRLNSGWEKVLKYLLELLQQRIPKGLAFRLTGNSGADIFRTLNSAKDIYGEFDVEVSSNSSSSNQGIQEQQAGEVLQMVQNPIAIQLGIIGPAQLYNAMENYLRAKGVRDFGKYVMKPNGPLRVLTPEEIANRVLRGMPAEVTMEQDHAGFINWFEMVKGEDEILGQFTEDQVLALAKQAQQHKQMLQSLQQMQAQANNAKQMQTNAAMSSQQASPGLNINNTGAGNAT